MQGHGPPDAELASARPGGDVSKPRSVGRHAWAVTAAASQLGVIARRQLVSVGWTDHMIDAQIAACRWSRMARGVYSTHGGVEPTVAAWWWAGHLLAGDESILAGTTALQAWGVFESELPVCIAIPWRHEATHREGYLVVRRRRRWPRVRTPRGCPPAMIVEEALLDVAAGFDSSEDVLSVVSRTLQKGRASAPRLLRVIGETSRVRHRSLLIKLVDEFADGATTALEIPGVRDILRRHGLPVGRGQVRERSGGRVRVRDRVLDEYGLVIELDGRLGHADPIGRFRDHARDNEVVASGRVVLRFGWVDVHEEACEAAVQVADVLRLRGWGGQIEPCGPACRARRG